MSEEESRRLSRRLFGRPKIWVSCLWLIVGLGWLGTAVLEPGAFRFFIAALWIVVGGAMLIVALRDRSERNRR
ncbi:hypothetical protein [Curtobacterium sp. MCSS17_016]|uniref:hypothetical protein n=1 Tax=Curtobacterium sp. MCSS17_016 TaxID=2175644 RepID=UPI0011B5A8AC|nr:hypothetical protein [Curtobacterium sp. MCSS17_016]WIE80558.1 hypothetical protein DEJ19_008330 [Curtobacterium sp. MCSS17_016]